jgi:ubiquinol-cytochrome c reductase iron-sulfur subunit
VTPRQWLVAFAALAWRRLARRRRLPEAKDGRGGGRRGSAGRIVPEGEPDRRAENLVVGLLLVAALFAVGFVVAYAEFSPGGMPNELLGGCLAGALGFLAIALGVFGKRLIVTEEIEEDYPSTHPEQHDEIARMVSESASRITRKKLLLGAATAAGGALGLAALTPALSLGPLWYTPPLFRSPWRRGSRLVDELGRPLKAAQVQQETVYTAFPEGADPEDIGSPVVVVRLEEDALQLPAARASWAPFGIVAYSKICTHAGCAVALYRKPRFPVVEPKPALVCPCHYSTFDPARAAAVIFGPAGRPLPQLPLMVDATGYLRAAGNFSGPPGPSWWGVREGRAT